MNDLICPRCRGHKAQNPCLCVEKSRIAELEEEVVEADTLTLQYRASSNNNSGSSSGEEYDNNSIVRYIR